MMVLSEIRLIAGFLCLLAAAACAPGAQTLAKAPTGGDEEAVNQDDNSYLAAQSVLMPY